MAGSSRDLCIWSAGYPDIAQQVRSGKLDPLGPLRDLMGLEE